MTTHADLADRTYAQAEASLLSHADNGTLADRVTTLDEYRRAYECVRTEMLEAYPDLEGPTIGNLLGEAAAAVWPAIVHAL